MDYFSNDHEDRPNQHKNSHKQSDDMRHYLLSLMKIEWKLRQQHGQHFKIEAKNKKLRVTVKDPRRKVNYLSKVI